ncbi:C78 family peptidase [Aspergillus glaucus CBS 516.65]|uniref:UFSP1/2/DUB catalytic domain-containing protein n=1 Tax=Aspergillus glaucus CBS 516.65 TaxID=1160497 RepID=A0A1L9W013_ASPGL|nr:hypothetical protein ASPGLDRAFT_41514 [Aspergillus glaucus CBS 516.65]OJJ89501.1 hypothetical protein ASPGLDRAFT_41514 [Aspergillus glaucus CBS 516.65]
MDHQNVDIPSCPFCPFSDTDAQFVTEHIEFCHPENGTEHGQFTMQPQEAASGYQRPSVWGETEYQADKYVDCPNGCGEVVTNTELSTHLDLHFAEEVAHEDPTSPQLGALAEESNGHRFDRFDDDHDVQDKYAFRTGAGKAHNPRSKTVYHKTVSVGGVKRLGRAELGPHANEKRMPSWLLKMLEKGPNIAQSNKISSDGTLSKHVTAENEASHVIPVLAKLCEQDTSVQRAFLCSPGVRHIFKMPREGGFCGYRNIQMLISYIQEAKTPGHEHFQRGLPTILELQDMIENAWDMGFNSVGRIETGGVRGTRKYIGTPEAQALFSSLGIQCEANSLAETQEMRAHDALYMDVAAYFRQACSLDGNDKVMVTELAPIYFQHQGHSLTIIGFEIRDNGSANLLVFDPMFKTSQAVKRLIGTSAKVPDPARLLKAYRRGSAYLQKYKLFEILKLPVLAFCVDYAER